MSAKPPLFIRVRPTETGVHDFAGAAVLALVRYKTTNQKWWRATYPEIATMLGDTGLSDSRVNAQKVGRIVRTLEAAGALLTRCPNASGDQTKEYQVAGESDTALTGQCSDMNGADQKCSDLNGRCSDMNNPRSDMNEPSFISEHSSSSFKELKRRKEREGSPARETSALIPANFHPSLAEWERLAQEYPGVDLDTELRKFIHHHQGQGSLRPDWLASFRSWLDKVPAFGTRTNGSGGADAKASEWAELGKKHTAEAAERAIASGVQQQLAIKPENRLDVIEGVAVDVVAGDSTGDGTLEATAQERRKQVAA